MLGLSLNGIIILSIRVVTLVLFGVMDNVKYFFGALIFFLIASLFLVVCAFGIFVVMRQDLIIFSLASMLDDREDSSVVSRNFNEIYNADDTHDFNEAVKACLQKQN